MHIKLQKNLTHSEEYGYRDITEQNHDVANMIYC